MVCCLVHLIIAPKSFNFLVVSFESSLFAFVFVCLPLCLSYFFGLNQGIFAKLAIICITFMLLMILVLYPFLIFASIA